MARPRKWKVRLTEEERRTLQEMLRKGNHADPVLKRARILLEAHEGRYDREIAERAGVTRVTVANVRKRYAREGPEAALHGRRPGRPPRPYGRREALLIALVRSAPPEGHRRWTLRLLADRLVASGVVDGISLEAVRKILKKLNANWRRPCGTPNTSTKPPTVGPGTSSSG